ncbi:PAS domain S-box protein, partial [Candidatus Bathyarchaeota archaeon]|nr:PAS domain S-box protein [Candidatus Bathyarchaeota archaeon]
EKEVIGTAFLEVSLLTAESKAILLKNLMKRMQGLSVEPYEINFTDKTGETRYVEVKAKKIDYAGQPADLVIFRDITRRKRNERRLKEYSEKMEALVNDKVKEVKESAQKLRESEEKYRKQFEEALDAIFVADAETGILIDCNRAASELVGREKPELVGEHQRILHPSEEIKGEFSRTYKQHLKEKEGQILEAQVITKRGEIKDIAIKANVFEFRGKKLIQGIFRDITERKKMEVALKQERDMLEAVTENIGAGLIIISKDYHTLWANGFIKRYKGDVEGKLCYATLNTLDTTCPDCGVKKVFENGATIDTHEYSSADINGRQYTVELIATPIKDKDGNVLAALEFAVDITEKKRMQSELAEYSQKLEKLVEQRTEQLKRTQAKLVKSERLAAIGELAAMVGHDLRNPLTGIKGAAYYLKTKHGAEIGAKGKEILETIEKAIDHSNKIINDLLDYSKDLTLEHVNTTPKLLLKNALSLVEVPERIKIIDATEDKLEIKADMVNMSRVFVNIITNAIDAMTESGTLTITSKAVKDNVKIIFNDTGTGMSEETLSKLWSPLFTTKAKGMGFGLSICKRIVEAHGGKLSVESAIGKGTTVTVTVPVNPKPATEDEETSVFNEPQLSVLIPRKVET